MVFAELVALGVTLALTLTFIKFWRRATYFDRKGIPYVKQRWPLGSDWNTNENRAVFFDNTYKEMEPYKLVGFYQYTQPAILVTDPDFALKVFTTDFSHFVDRFDLPKGTSPLEAHLFAIAGAKWRFLRAKLSPIFTSGKLKFMFTEMSNCVDTFTQHLKTNLSIGTDVDMREECRGLTTEVISSCGFGLESKTIGNPDSEFRQFMKLAFGGTGPFVGLRYFLRSYLPSIYMLFRFRTIHPAVEDFVMTLMTQSFEHRLKNGLVRNDFIQLLLQLREKGSVEFEANDNEVDEDEGKHWDCTKEANKEVFELDDGILGAQVFSFLVGGFETTASVIYHLMYYLSVNPDCQEKAREEVKSVMAKSGDGNITYEMVKNFPYLEHCVEETLRFCPPLPYQTRLCVKDYTFPDGTSIEKGVTVIIPTYAFHRDPKYFPEPEKFKPERFEEAIVKGAYSPFGLGPRMCIGKRFAMVEIQLAMARFLTNFRLLPSTQQNELKLAPKTFLFRYSKPLHVRIEKIQ